MIWLERESGQEAGREELLAEIGLSLFILVLLHSLGEGHRLGTRRGLGVLVVLHVLVLALSLQLANLEIFDHPHLPEDAEIGLHIGDGGDIGDVEYLLPEFEVLGPGGQEAVGGQHVELVLQEALHPLYVVILPAYFQLLRNEVAEFAPRDYLQLLERLLEHVRQLALYLRCLLVDLADLLAHLVQQLLQLVLPLLEVRVHLVDFCGNLGEVVAYFFEGVGRHGPIGVCAVDLAADTHTFVALTTKQFILALLVTLAYAEIEYGFL